MVLGVKVMLASYITGLSPVLRKWIASSSFSEQILDSS
jgi:hypothetical protein